MARIRRLSVKLLGISSIALLVAGYAAARYVNNGLRFLLLAILLAYWVAWGCCVWYKEKRREKLTEEEQGDNQCFIRALRLSTKFSYAALELATQGFATILGAGGCGSVYEGRLEGGIRVAVKRFKRTDIGHEEFFSKLAAIAHIRHVNLVRLLGFCFEGSHRLVVYEFVENGSLDTLLFRKNHADQSPKVLDWRTRFTIGLETARALAYLHEECEVKILHLDVKPQNILLDRDFHVKVADYGLSCSLHRNQSRILTTRRGTPGYLAPERLLDSVVSNKSDVFSYGMVLLELVSGRKNVDHSEDSSNWYFPKVACIKAREGKVHEITDSALGDSVDEKQAQRVLGLALWCIHEDAEVRPTMAKVTEMLQGNLEVTQPSLPLPLPTVVSFYISFSRPPADLSYTVITVDEAASPR